MNVSSSESWVVYFKSNAQTRPPISWHFRERCATRAQLDAITSSIQEFQLGESGEGAHFIRCAMRYAAQTGDVAYVDALRLFIAEEHRHATDLGRFMDIAGIRRIAHAWPDAIFRWLRHRAGLELSIAVLVTAEVIAKVSYAALRDATDSIVLREMCEQILADEIEHVRFQCERLAILRRGRARWGMRVTRWMHDVFVAGTLLVVWHKHGRALRAGGYRWKRFRRAARHEMRDAMTLADPETYSWSESSSRRIAKPPRIAIARQPLNHPGTPPTDLVVIAVNAIEESHVGRIPVRVSS